MKRRLNSHRLTGHDYAHAGFYFVTMCTKNRRRIFGEIIQGTMRLSSAGGVVRAQILGLTSHYPHVEVDTWVIMPDHVHVLFAIQRPQGPAPPMAQRTGQRMGGFANPPVRGAGGPGGDGVAPGGDGGAPDAPDPEPAMGQRTGGFANPPVRGVADAPDAPDVPDVPDAPDAPDVPDAPDAPDAQRVRHGISEVVRALKTYSARAINALRGVPGKPLWARGFHDWIVLDVEAVQRVRQYIRNNPKKWELSYHGLAAKYLSSSPPSTARTTTG